MDERPHLGVRLDRVAHRALLPGGGRLADQQALHLVSEDDRDDAEQEADDEASRRVEAGVAGEDGERHAHQGHYQPDQCAQIFQEHYRQLGRL